MKRLIMDSDSQSELQELSCLEMENTNGGSYLATAGLVVGICAGFAYLYEFGYNMVDNAFKNSK